MPNAQSDTRPPDMLKSGGKIHVNYNIVEGTIEDERGTRTIFSYDYVVVGDVDRSTLINAMISDRYSKSAEFALINNRSLGKPEDVSEYDEYQAFRTNVKSIVDSIQHDT